MKSLMQCNAMQASPGKIATLLEQKRLAGKFNSCNQRGTNHGSPKIRTDDVLEWSALQSNYVLAKGKGKKKRGPTN